MNFIKSNFSFFILLCFFSIPIAAQTTLVFNTTGQHPLNTAEHNGFLDEVTREALARIGFQLEINRLPAERALLSVNTGIIDAEMSRIKGLEKIYANLVRVPEKIMDWEFNAFHKEPMILADHKLLPKSQLLVIKPSPSPTQIKKFLPNGFASLTDKTVAYIKGWKILENNIPQSALMTKARNSQQLFSLLERDRVEYIIYERWGGIYLANKLPCGIARIVQPALLKKEMFIYFHKKHQALVPKLAQALAEMKKDGSYGLLVAKHLTPLFEQHH